jgi:hypothetical protein
MKRILSMADCRGLSEAERRRVLDVVADSCLGGVCTDGYPCDVTYT